MDKLGGYTLLEKLGEGTTGIVYKARDDRQQRRVAVKVALPHTDELRARLMREAQAMAGLSDSHIPAIYEIGEDRGRMYYSRAYIEGTTLEQHVSEKCLLLPDVVKVLVAIARTVHHVHTCGIVHRRLQRANILIGSAGVSYLIGFGKAGCIAWDAETARAYPDLCPATDLQALHSMLAWVFASYQQTLPAQLEALRGDASVASAAIIADRIEQWLPACPRIKSLSARLKALKQKWYRQ